jgi:hypothetical protein
VLKKIQSILQYCSTFSPHSIMFNTRRNLTYRQLLATALLGTAFLSGCGGGGGTADSAAVAFASTDTGLETASLSATSSAASARTLATTSCAANWGTFDRPFSSDSPWNSRPESPVLGPATIPTSSYYPSVASGAYSSAAFMASATDGPVTVTGTTSNGVWDPDSEAYKPSITIPHWPAGVTPASGSDGHAEIVDTSTGIVHSFFKLKHVNGSWQAQQYAWTPLAGRGMGNPSHYFQGARAAGVSTLGGLIRIAEANDGDTQYRHALAMSLTFNGLSADPTYQFPATSSDSNAATTNSGQIPMGSLMLLPSSFNAQTLATPELRKVAETLKTYGAYVVDRNYGTPFVIYVENGANFKLHKNGWSNATAADLNAIRAALRPLTTASGWLDGNGQIADVTSTDLNLLSMRGYWYRSKGTQSGVYDTWKQAVVFPATTAPIEQVNSGGRAYSGVKWGTPAVGTRYRLTAIATGGARFRMTITDKTSNVVVYDSGDMSNAQSTEFDWPAASFKIITYAKSGVGGVESTVSAQLVKAGGTTASASTSSCTN